MDEARQLEILRARATLMMVPRSLWSELELSPEFYERADIPVAQTISFGGTPTFEVSALLDAIRSVQATGRRARLKDRTDGAIWSLDADKDAPGELVLQRKGRRFAVPQAFALHPDAAVRLALFETAAQEAEFAPAEAQAWRERLSQGPLPDRDFDALDVELALSPARVRASLQTETTKPNIDLTALVPKAAPYYERLAGVPAGAADIVHFFDGPGRALFERLGAEPAQALSRSLLLGAHPHCARAILAAFGPDLRLADPPRDPFSRLAYLEYLCLTADPDPDEVVAASKAVRTDLEDSSPAAALLTSMLEFVDGRFARLGLFDEAPPYWRRLAALAHGAVLWRVLPPPLIRDERFREALSGFSKNEFAIATLLDLRREPRWLPRFASQEQFKAEIIGRLLGALVRFRDRPEPELKAELFALDGLFVGYAAAAAFLPGPCEGGTPAVADIGAEQSRTILEGLTATPPEPEALRALVANGLILRIPQALTDAAAATVEALIRNSPNADPGEELAGLASHLAQLAATTRHPPLAAQVRTLCRAARRQVPPRIDPLIEFEAAIMASAAHAEPDDYGALLGSWLEELCTESKGAVEAMNLHHHITLMAYRDPTLWGRLAPALALSDAAAKTKRV